MSESEKKPLIIPKDWSDAASSVSCSSLQPPVALVCGPKDSGKSTFSRNLVKVLLQRSLLYVYNAIFSLNEFAEDVVFTDTRELLIWTLMLVSLSSLYLVSSHSQLSIDQF